MAKAEPCVCVGGGVSIIHEGGVVSIIHRHQSAYVDGGLMCSVPKPQACPEVLPPRASTLGVRSSKCESEDST